ncbi:Fic family protein [Lancefieldella rimae]|uniref:Fic family protein n=2 Tax=Lancefieldella rimae TaxID=1383 RepID=B9CP94_LANR4|nr:Fic family protein [Lancefieldella rimae]EEE16630.1 Fic family protein [Lancefieldella rimae ATCC 49626]KRO01348.1 Fic family protein [Lancefieldella rimae]
MSYQPPFTLNNQMLDYVADIAQKVGQVDAYGQLSRSPQLRKENRIRTIHSSLAIENNTLSLEQVTAVIEGKHVIAPPKDLLEVQNAIKVYEDINSFDPLAIDDLLRAHKQLMGGLVSEAGRLRSGNVGVFAGDKLIHAGTPAKYVPNVLADLFSWLASGEVHPLITSCVFHYEFEFIHPFQDGNGRMGRLWQTLILSRWNDLFAWLPVETLVKEHQEDYYDTLAGSDEQGDCTQFIEFMLGMISQALDDVITSGNDDGINDGINDGIKNEAENMRERLLLLVRKNPSMTVKQMASELGVSIRQAERIVSSLKQDKKLVRIGANRNGRWEVR